MANDANNIDPADFSSGRGLYVDNQPAELVMVNKDASTTVTVDAEILTRIYSAKVFDADGNEIDATIDGLGTNSIDLSDLGTDTLDLVVLLMGSRL